MWMEHCWRLPPCGMESSGTRKERCEEGGNHLRDLKVTWRETAGQQEAWRWAPHVKETSSNANGGAHRPLSRLPQLQHTGKVSRKTGRYHSRRRRALVIWNMFSPKAGESRHSRARETDAHTVHPANCSILPSHQPLHIPQYCPPPQCPRSLLHSLQLLRAFHAMVAISP